MCLDTDGDGINTTRGGGIGGGGYPKWRRNGQVKGGERSRASYCQGVEALCPLTLMRKDTRQETKNQKMQRLGRELREVETGEKGRRREMRQANPPGTNRDLRVGQGHQRGGHTVMVNGDRRRHLSWGADMISGGWRVAGEGDIQVGGALRQERRWGAVENR